MVQRVALIVLSLLITPVSGAARERRPPDFNGLWSNATLTDFERPERFKTLVIADEAAAAFEKERRGKPPEAPPDDNVGGIESEWWETDVGLTRIDGQARSSLLTFPEDGQVPASEASRAAQKARRARRMVDFDNPESRGRSERCLSADSAGPPMIGGGYNDNYLIVQTPELVAIYSEGAFAVRIIRLNDKPHPPFNQRFEMGDSAGHWEGQTLVIETTNFTPAEVGAPDGDPKADMRVVERMTRLASGEIHYAFQVEDPASSTQPWRGEQLFHPSKGPIYEYACHEGNYSFPSMLRAARAADAARPLAAE